MCGCHLFISKNEPSVQNTVKANVNPHHAGKLIAP